MSDATRASYDRVAARYAAELGDELTGKPLDRALLDAFAELVHGVVLDVGGGPGHVADHLARRGVPVVHTDLSPRMCALAPVPSVAADMTALPFRAGCAGGIVCLYAVIHLDAPRRAAAYASFLRVLRPGGLALVSLHTRDADNAVGGETTLSSWWGEPVALTFRFLDPDAEHRALLAAGFAPVARLDRSPGAGEHQSERSYLLVRRPA